jgi:Zn-dependent protease/CBS domain-containing protein
MGWSFRIGRVLGIGIFVHFTFLILLGFVGLEGFLRTGDPVVGLLGLVLTTVVFGIIVLHELGHAMAARHYGIPTKDITLLPIGGVARLQRMPDKPAQELVVALAGPAVNVVLAVVCGGLLLIEGSLNPNDMLTLSGSVLQMFFKVNVFLVAFNLLPAFPMDGGRVLRALLAMRLGSGRATEIAAQVGKVMAVVFGIVGVVGIPGCVSGLNDGNPMLLLVAWFVWTGAEAEARALRAKVGLAKLSAAAIMERRFAAVDPDDTLGSVAAYSRQAFQRHFPVVVSGRVVGLLSREDLRAGLTEFGPDGRVFQAMRRRFATITADESADRGLALLASGELAVPVLAYGQLAGMLTREHIAEIARTDGPVKEDPDRSAELRSKS